MLRSSIAVMKSTHVAVHDVQPVDREQQGEQRGEQRLGAATHFACREGAHGGSPPRPGETIKGKAGLHRVSTRDLRHSIASSPSLEGPGRLRGQLLATAENRRKRVLRLGTFGLPSRHWPVAMGWLD